MKRFLVLLGSFLLLAAPTLAVRGPEPGSPDFFLIFTNLDTRERLNVLSFDTATGWDFGDRAAYKCAWTEHFTNGNGLDFYVAFTRMAEAPYMQVNDKYGAEAANECVHPDTGEIVPRSEVNITLQGEDHLPHLVHEGDGFTFFRNGQQFEYLDLAVGQCADSYWVPGDEAGEAILWWDPDGPTSSHQEGVNDLPCGGGPQEPFATIHAQVVPVASNLRFCTHSAHEDLCSDVEPSPTTTTSPIDRFCERHPNHRRCD